MMSSRNLFIINNTGVNNFIRLKNIEVELVNLANYRKIGIHFNVLGYHDELINLLNIKHNYFCISESFTNIESEDIFSTNDSFEYIYKLKLNKTQSEIKEKNLLIKKFTFLNEIINIIFNNLPNISSVDFYISDQYSSTLTSYQTIEVVDKDLTKALVDSYEPTKKYNYFGLKTVKLVIK